MVSEDRLIFGIKHDGWRGINDQIWNRLDDFKNGSVILAPPLDTIPSPTGNAIYTLIEQLAFRLSQPTLVLARWPAMGTPLSGPISDRILYDTNPLSPNWLERKTPYRVKRYLTGMGAPYLYAYAYRSAVLCRKLSIKKIVVEDIPSFCWMLRLFNRRAKLYLHQHNNAPKLVSGYHWKMALSSLNGILFVSRDTCEFTERRHGRLSVPNAVVYNGVDLTHYDSKRWFVKGVEIRSSLGISPSACVFLYVGRIVPMKGVTEAAEAFLAAQPQDFHLIIIGDMDERLFASKSYIERLRRVETEAKGKLHLLGVKQQPELPAYYAASDVVIVPSIGSEGLPKVVTEALAMGKPVMASNRGGIFEWIQPGYSGWVIDNPEDIESFSKLICEVAQSRDTILRYSDIILSTIRAQMDQKKMVERFEEFINF